MATKKVTKIQSSKVAEEDLVGGQLDSKEEKVLDWILNAIVVFVLGWLGLGILLSLGGLAGLWK